MGALGGRNRRAEAGSCCRARGVDGGYGSLAAVRSEQRRTWSVAGCEGSRLPSEGFVGLGTWGSELFESGSSG